MMKKITTLILFMLLGFSNSLFSQSKFEKILNTLNAIFQTVAEEHYQAVNVASETITINSSTNFGGKTRGAVKFTLPAGTKEYAVRVTVIPVKSNFQYESDESFFSVIQKGSGNEVAAPQNNGINVFFFNRSYDAQSFVDKGNFHFIWRLDNVNSFVQSRPADAGNYWIGVMNPSSVYGLKTIVEVVALGVFQ
jgi:hypothetical protein